MAEQTTVFDFLERVTQTDQPSKAGPSASSRPSVSELQGQRPSGERVIFARAMTPAQRRRWREGGAR